MRRRILLCTCSPALGFCMIELRIRQLRQETSFQSLIDAFVEQDLHLTSVRTRAFAVSSTATTCSRVTVGKPSKNSSIVSPASRYSKRVWTGTRVPANTGVPPIISGELVIKLVLIQPRLWVKAFLRQALRPTA